MKKVGRFGGLETTTQGGHATIKGRE